MSERDEQAWQSGSPTVRDGADTTRQLPPQDPHGAPRQPAAEEWRQQTTPGMTPVRGGAAADPSVGAQYASAPGYGATAGYGGGPGQGAGPYTGGPPATDPQYSSRPVAFRRSDALGGLLLVLAGVAAGVSLRLHWVRDGAGTTGWSILRAALSRLTEQRSGFVTEGWWEPVVILFGGALLSLVGLLLWLPARTHRFLGVVALLVALAVTAGVLTPMAQDGWSTASFDLGWWFAAAVAALGLLGALKAALTGPRMGSAEA